jgi:hypothetical protein
LIATLLQPTLPLHIAEAHPHLKGSGQAAGQQPGDSSGRQCLGCWSALLQLERDPHEGLQCTHRYPLAQGALQGIVVVHSSVA